MEDIPAQISSLPAGPQDQLQSLLHRLANLRDRTHKSRGMPCTTQRAGIPENNHVLNDPKVFTSLQLPPPTWFDQASSKSDALPPLHRLIVRLSIDHHYYSGFLDRNSELLCKSQLNSNLKRLISIMSLLSEAAVSASTPELSERASHVAERNQYAIKGDRAVSIASRDLHTADESPPDVECVEPGEPPITSYPSSPTFLSNSNQTCSADNSVYLDLVDVALDCTLPAEEPEDGSGDAGYEPAAVASAPAPEAHPRDALARPGSHSSRTCTSLHKRRDCQRELHPAVGDCPAPRPPAPTDSGQRIRVQPEAAYFSGGGPGNCGREAAEPGRPDGWGGQAPRRRRRLSLENVDMLLQASRERPARTRTRTRIRQ